MLITVRKILKLDPTRRKMSRDELQTYLREINRGCGTHGVKSRRTERRKYKQSLRNGGDV